MANSSIKKFLDAGVQFTEMSKQQAEGLVKSLVKGGEVRRKDAEHLVESLLSRGRDTTEKVAAMVQAEVAQQVAALTGRFEELEHRIESLAGSRKQASQAAAPAPAAKAAAKKAPAKKAPAKQAPAKKAPAVGSSGVRKVSSTRTG
jgi:polyhydroxyalkanoate synthesis regulator phasin